MKQLCEVQSPPSGQVVELRSARESISQNNGVRPGIPYGGKQVVLGHLDRDLVVLSLIHI